VSLIPALELQLERHLPKLPKSNVVARIKKGVPHRTWVLSALSKLRTQGDIPKRRWHGEVIRRAGLAGRKEGERQLRRVLADLRRIGKL
jgi:hypothetical protein